MVRLVPRAFAATVALLAAGFSSATASADPVLVFPGMEIRQDNHVCTLGYVDPALKIAFTAGPSGTTHPAAPPWPRTS